jgi:hypothetical protein
MLEAMISLKWLRRGKRKYPERTCTTGHPYMLMSKSLSTMMCSMPRAPMVAA